MLRLLISAPTLRCFLIYVEIKREIKTEDDHENQQQEPPSSEQEEAAGRAENIKVEDKGGNLSRKRPHEDNKAYNYYEHREEKR